MKNNNRIEGVVDRQKKKPKFGRRKKKDPITDSVSALYRATDSLSELQKHADCIHEALKESNDTLGGLEESSQRIQLEANTIARLALFATAVALITSIISIWWSSYLFDVNQRESRKQYALQQILSAVDSDRSPLNELDNALNIASSHLGICERLYDLENVARHQKAERECGLDLTFKVSCTKRDNLREQLMWKARYVGESIDKLKSSLRKANDKTTLFLIFPQIAKKPKFNLYSDYLWSSSLNGVMLLESLYFNDYASGALRIDSTDAPFFADRRRMNEWDEGYDKAKYKDRFSPPKRDDIPDFRSYLLGTVLTYYTLYTAKDMLVNVGSWLFVEDESLQKREYFNQFLENHLRQTLLLDMEPNDVEPPQCRQQKNDVYNFLKKLTAHPDWRAITNISNTEISDENATSQIEQLIHEIPYFYGKGE
ncbi:hypothetical protein WE348_01200 [Alteromonas macleodii]|uniref:hypothetical protein n=1 Tax=Alteromonas macleodii TaxID=28108 RepID=UPI0030D5DDC8